jgi:hypothetical protein
MPSRRRKWRRSTTIRAVTLGEFKRTTAANQPPPDLSQPLLALWHDARGDWASAHQTAQDIDNATGAWIHAYLHRKEGDSSNASYWYRRAGKAVCRESLESEWEHIATTLLAEV